MSYGKLAKTTNEVFYFLDKDKEILGGLEGINIETRLVSKEIAHDWRFLETIEEGDVWITINPTRDYSRARAYSIGDCVHLWTKDPIKAAMQILEISGLLWIMGFDASKDSVEILEKLVTMTS